MARYELEARYSALHDSVIVYASAVQNAVAGSGGCKSLSSEALNALAYAAALTHRSIRTLCEEGWTPVTPILNRTLLDIVANSYAIVSQGKAADYMGFKYMSDFLRKFLIDKTISTAMQLDAEYELARLINALPKADIDKANVLVNESKPKVYFFQPEFASTKAIMETSSHNIYDLFQVFSGVTHGGLTGKLLFDDDPSVEDIDPRDHPKNTRRAIVASSRLLAEVCYIRDHWETMGVHDGHYQSIVADIIALP
jgi:hypothetical protein